MALFLPERELREKGFSEPLIATLRKLTKFVEAQEAIAAAEGAIDAAEADIATLTTAVNANTTKNTAQDGRLDTLEAAGPYVEQDQAAAPSYTAFAGQTITDPPTQAEVQAIDDGLATLGTAMEDLISALQTANVLT